MFKGVCATALVLLAIPAAAQDGAALYGGRCGPCHDGGIVRAPSRLALSQMTPERIVASLAGGSMRTQGANLSVDERRAIAVFLSGQPLGALTPTPTALRCATSPARFTATPSSAWTGWSPTLNNDRCSRSG